MHVLPAMAFAPSSVLLFLAVRPGAPSSVLAPSSKALVTNSFLLLPVRHLLLLVRHLLLVAMDSVSSSWASGSSPVPGMGKRHLGRDRLIELHLHNTNGMSHAASRLEASFFLFVTSSDARSP